MARITKEPEERKNEILDAAIGLFTDNGFENTSVSDIVRKLNIAQGTFYYYFKSKDELLNAVVEHFGEHILEGCYEAFHSPEMNAKEKIEGIVKAVFSYTNWNQDFVAFVHSEKNEILHYRAAKKYISTFIPVMIGIVKQGIREGLFDIQYPEVISTIGVTGVMDFFHYNQEDLYDVENLKQRKLAIAYFLKRALGLKEGEFNLLD